MITITKFTGIDKDSIMERMIEDVRKNRCRTLTQKDVALLLDEVNEEMIGGRNMFKYLTEDAVKPQQNDEDLR